MLTLLLGGARSGKSALGLQLAQASPAPVTFIATAEGRDEEMAARIRAHRAERPTAWSTVEEPVHLERALGGVTRAATVVIDCLTLWVANLVERGAADAAVGEEAAAVAAEAAAREGNVIAISNEVGSGIVPGDPGSRRYRDLLGHVNTTFAHHAGDAFLVGAGRLLVLRPATLNAGQSATFGATQTATLDATQTATLDATQTATLSATQVATLDAGAIADAERRAIDTSDGARGAAVVTGRGREAS